MAGTRLQIQVLFVVETILLTASGLWYGLCRTGDDLCVDLFQNGPFLSVSSSLLDSEDQPMPPTLQFIVPSLTVAAWQRAMKDIAVDIDNIHVLQDTEKHQQVCLDRTIDDSRRSGENDGNNSPIYVCSDDGFVQNSQSMKVFPSALPAGALVVPTAEIDRAASCLFGEAMSSMDPHKSLELTLMIDDGTINASHLWWKPLSGFLDDWIEETAIDAWPFWKEAISTNVRVGTILASISHVEQDSVAVFPISSVRDAIQDGVVMSTNGIDQQDQDRLKVILYAVHHKNPMFGSDSSLPEHMSKAILIDDNLVIVLVGSLASKTDVFDAMSNTVDMFERNSLFCPQQHVSPLPAQVDLWVRLAVLREHQYIRQQLPRLVTTTRNVEKHLELQRRIQWVQDRTAAAAMAAQNGEWEEALVLLRPCRREMADIATSPLTAPSVVFAPELALAIFAPLLVPLLLPAVLRLGAEYKRYRKLS